MRNHPALPCPKRAHSAPGIKANSRRRSQLLGAKATPGVEATPGVKATPGAKANSRQTGSPSTPKHTRKVV
jgi:hypothetical protein